MSGLLRCMCSAASRHLKRERQLECVDDALETQLQRHRRRIRRRGRHAERVAHCSAGRRADRKCTQAREREERKQPDVEVVAKAVLLTSTSEANGGQWREALRQWCKKEASKTLVGAGSGTSRADKKSANASSLAHISSSVYRHSKAAYARE